MIVCKTKTLDLTIEPVPVRVFVCFHPIPSSISCIQIAFGFSTGCPRESDIEKEKYCKIVSTNSNTEAHHMFHSRMRLGECF
jgi:hypothetical protein